MKQLAIKNGDLVIEPGGKLGLVTGQNKLRQDLSHAMLEPAGGDRFHPRWGSTLSSMIGGTITEDVGPMVEIEARRVIGNYMSTLSARMQQDQIQGRPSMVTAEEVPLRVEGFRVHHDIDRIHLAVTIKSLVGEANTIVTVER